MTTKAEPDPPSGGSSEEVWTTETPYRFPISRAYDDISKPIRNSWSVLCDEQNREDLELCEMWKDEIQSLLTFAGLFSSVLTGFLAGTYRDLQQDPNASTTLLLAQIVSRLDVVIGLGNATDISPLSLIPLPDPRPYLVRMHVLWFLSLITSLLTAAVGISCLQWIREYKRPNPDLSFRATFALQSMRKDALTQWRVPDIIAFLPVFLTLSLALFFAGMVDFLLPLGAVIATPSLVAIGLVFFFLIGTTVTPAVQTLVLLCRHATPKPGKMSVPCPYKSPQAWRLFLFLRQCWSILLAGAHTTASILFDIWQRIRDPTATRPSFWFYLTHTWSACVTGPMSGYFSFFPFEWGTDGDWLNQRHRLFTAGDSSKSELAAFSSDWDASNGLIFMLDHTSLSYSLPQVMYRCFKDLPPSLAGSSFFANMETIASLDPYNDQVADRRVCRAWKNVSPQLLKLEYVVLLLNTLAVTHKPKLDHVVLRHQLELYVRILAGVFAGPNWLERERGLPALDTFWTFHPRMLRPDESYFLARITGGDECASQLVAVLSQLVETAIKRGSSARLCEYHESGDIRFLVQLTMTAFTSLATPQSTSKKPITPSVKRMFEQFTNMHYTLHSFLSTHSSLPDAQLGEFDIVLATACHYSNIALHQFLADLAAQGDCAPSDILADYVSSFRLLTQQCNEWIKRVSPSLQALIDPKLDPYLLQQLELWSEKKSENTMLTTSDAPVDDGSPG